MKFEVQITSIVVAVNTGKSEDEILKAMHERTTLNPEQAKTLINFACKILSPFFGGSIPLLP